MAKMAVKFEWRNLKFYSVIFRLFIVLRIWKLSMGSVLFNFNFELMLLFIGDFKIVLERFFSSLLHYRYMDSIQTVVRAQLDYSMLNTLYSVVWLPQNVNELKAEHNS
jgi:hypothetical protein